MKRNIIVVTFIISVCVHVIGFSVFSLYTTTRGNPVIYFWPNIIDRVNVGSVGTMDVHIPEREMLSTQQLTRDYFFTPESYPKATMQAMQKQYPSSLGVGEIDNATAYMYLWEKSSPYGAETKEQISYRAFVSPSGKVIFLFPQKLPVNSFANLLQEEYTRESVFFLNDKFSWTKIEAVVQ